MNSTNAITMTSVEIAAMTGKRHDNVLRDADRIIENVAHLKSEAGSVEATYLDGNKQERRMLVLSKQMVFTIITGYDSGLRHTVIGRWIELELAANPMFGSQAITDTLNDLQTRVDMMAPVYAEHVRKGTSGHGHTWSAACFIADVPPQIAKSYFKAIGRFERERPKVVSLETSSGPIMPTKKGFDLGYFKRKKYTGHGQNKDGFNVTNAGLEWLKGYRDAILAWDIERKKIRPVVDAEGYVIDISGHGGKGMTVVDLPREATR
nr:Rha family transcriptional regulator [uncultured Pseudomonas sp.]